MIGTTFPWGDHEWNTTCIALNPGLLYSCTGTFRGQSLLFSWLMRGFFVLDPRVILRTRVRRLKERALLLNPNWTRAKVGSGHKKNLIVLHCLVQGSEERVRFYGDSLRHFVRENLAGHETRAKDWSLQHVSISFETYINCFHWEKLGIVLCPCVNNNRRVRWSSSCLYCFELVCE